MAFNGKLSGVEGRRLFFGERKKDDAGNPLNDYECVFTLKQDGKVVRGEWPNFDLANLSDLKTGMEVSVKGVEGSATSGDCHTVVIPGKASSRARTHELEDREAAKAAKKRKSAEV